MHRDIRVFTFPNDATERTEAHARFERNLIKFSSLAQTHTRNSRDTLRQLTKATAPAAIATAQQRHAFDSIEYQP